MDISVCVCVVSVSNFFYLIIRMRVKNDFKNQNSKVLDLMADSDSVTSKT